MAVTGTAGKTSVASFTRQIWAHSGFSAAMIGTTGVVAPGRTEYGSLTTPDPVSLHKLLAELADEGVTHAAMEASSHGLDQRRLDGVELAAAAFTNLGRDHMDYHPTVEHYMASKMRLFGALLPKGSPAVIFADDQWSAEAIAAARKAGHDVRTVGRNGDFIALKRVEHFRHKQSAEVHVGDDIYEIHVPLAGDFQIANALVAAGLAMSTGITAKAAFSALERLQGASGRLELVGQTKDGALAYGITPTTGRTRKRAGVRASLYHRPGRGGFRVRRRPGQGQAPDHGRDCQPPRRRRDRHRRQSAFGSTGSDPCRDHGRGQGGYGNRRSRRGDPAAVGMLKTGDTLIVAGKGHEEGQTVGSVTLPFSDHAEVRKALGGL